MHASRAAASGQINRGAVKRCGGATGDARRDKRDSRGAARSAGKSPTWSCPHKIMGADIAAGPHCPFASDPAGKARHSRRAVSRNENLDRSPGSATSGGPSATEAASGLPRGLPVRAEALAVRRLANSEPKFLFPPWRFLRPKPPVPRPAGFEAEASLPPDKSMDLRPGSLPLRSSRAETRSCPTCPEPKLLPRRWQRANRSPTFCRAGPGLASGVRPVRFLKPEGSLVPGGRFTKPAAFAFAEGQARHRPPGGGFVSRPAVRFHPPCRPKATGPISTWAVAGKATLRCRKIVLATTHSCHEKWGRESPIWLWITRITCITSSAPERRIDALAPAAAPA